MKEVGLKLPRAASNKSIGAFKFTDTILLCSRIVLATPIIRRKPKHDSILLSWAPAVLGYQVALEGRARECQ